MIRIFFLVVLFPTLSFGQCPDYDKLEKGGTYLSWSNNYIPFEVKYKDTIYRDDISYPNDLELIKKHSDYILSQSQAYIINRAGEDFYKNIQLESIEVNYPDTIKVKYENQELYDLEKFDVKYWILYTYRKDTYKYAFGLLFDKLGNMISENKFPDVTHNLNFESYTSPCDALNLVRQDRRFKGKKIDFIELAYVDEVNSFCWLIKEQKLPTKLGINEYTEDSYFINANSNKLEKIEVDNVRSIACGIGPITKKKKKKYKR